MAGSYHLRLGFRQISNNRNIFEFTISTPLLRVQFRIPRSAVNRLRVDLERALTKK